MPVLMIVQVELSRGGDKEETQTRADIGRAPRDLVRASRGVDSSTGSARTSLRLPRTISDIRLEPVRERFHVVERPPSISQTSHKPHMSFDSLTMTEP